LTIRLLSSTGIAPVRADDQVNGYPHPASSNGPVWMHGQSHYGRPGQWPDRHWEPAQRGPAPRPEVYHREPRPTHQAHGYGWSPHYRRPVFVPVYRTRYYRDVVVIRRYGHVYPGYGYYQNDEDAYKWLAFTAITLKVLDNLNEAQERAHEQAQAEATTAPVGDTIYWNQSDASGAVSVVRDGYSASGRYCREFQQEVTIGGRSERAYGTACQQPDGSWQVVSTGE
jgi:hypothetical protein